MNGSSQGSTAARPTAEGWEAAVAEASRHVAERGEAAQAASELQRPRSEGPRVVAGLVALAAVVGVNAYLWTRPPEPMPVAQERAHLAYVAVDVVEAIEDFVVERGRVPTAEEVVELVGEDVEYHRRDGGYQVVVTGEGSSLVYDGTVPAREWAAIQAAPCAASGRRGES